MTISDRLLTTALKHQEPVSKLKQLTLDELWNEARSLGRIQVDSDYKGEKYTVEIKFQRKTGTRIIACGSDSNIHFAFSKAIDEAREMGAG